MRTHSIALTALRAAAPSDAPQAEHLERVRRAAALARAAMRAAAAAAAARRAAERSPCTL